MQENIYLCLAPSLYVILQLRMQKHKTAIVSDDLSHVTEKHTHTYRQGGT